MKQTFAKPTRFIFFPAAFIITLTHVFISQVHTELHNTHHSVGPFLDNNS